MDVGIEHLDVLDRLLDIERRSEQERFQEQQGSLSAVDRVTLGFAVADLQAVEEAWGFGGRILITFTRPDDAPIEAKIDAGSVVTVRRRIDNPADAVQAVVSRRRDSRLQLAFDELPPEFVQEGRVWVEVQPNDVTYKRAKGAIQAVRAMENGQARQRRDVLLGKAPARCADVPPPVASQSLNPEQHRAVVQALAARDFSLVHGPPGTGKSTVLAEVAVQACRNGQRILCTAASNAAVDHLLELCVQQKLRAVRIGHPARVSERLHPYIVDDMLEKHPERQLAQEWRDQAAELLGYARRQRRQGRSAERFINARGAQAEARRLRDDAAALEKQLLRGLLADAQVICATCTALAGGELRDQTFDLVLFDEATQATEPLALLPFLCAPTVILAGDPQQLPPTVISPEAAAGGLGVSLFERLLRQQADLRVLLREQYRMHDSIMAFASSSMYEGALRAHVSVAGHTLPPLCAGPIEAPPILFLDTAGKGFDEERSTQGLLSQESLRNPGEAQMIVARVEELLQAGLPARAIAVITPYRAQASALRQAVQILSREVEVDTVDAFQGREKEAILLSMVRSNDSGELGFLSDLRRMNVAITRARRHLFVVGDSGTLGSHPYYRAFLQHVEGLGGYVSAWEWPRS